MFVVPIDDLNDPRIADFRNVPDPELLRQRGVFVAEGRLVVRTLLTASRYRPRSLLVTEAVLRSVQDLFDGGQDDEQGVPLFLATPACMREIIGFNVHRGCLALGERPAELSMACCRPARTRGSSWRSKGSAMPTTSAACFEMPPRLGPTPFF